MKSRPRIFLPNRLSLLRIFLGFLIPFLLLWPFGQGKGAWSLWLAFGLFLLGVFTDFWDGWLARRHRLETPIGRILDPTADKIFTLSTMAGFAARGVYSYWVLVPIFLREIAVTVARVIWLHQGYAIGAERAGKLKLGLQVTSVLFSFLYLFWPQGLTLSVNYFFLVLALAMTLVSGFFFFRHHQKLLQDPQFAKRAAALGVGTLPPFPGTYATLLGMAIVGVVAFDPLLHLGIFLIFLTLAYGLISRMGLAKEEDPPEVVIDEVCGILLAFWLVPLHWKSLLVGFLVFRFFDVSKIFPLGWLEKRRGVHGIILDDLGAGVLTWLVLKILFR